MPITPILLNTYETSELSSLGSRGIQTMDVCSEAFLDKLIGTMVLQMRHPILQYGENFQIAISIKVVPESNHVKNLDNDYIRLYDRDELLREAPFLFLSM